MTAAERAAKVIGETWYQGGGAYPGPGPSWKVMAQALADAGLLVTDELIDLIASLTEASACWFDHHGGCQEHGYLGLEPGDVCPMRQAQDWLTTHGYEGQVTS